MLMARLNVVKLSVLFQLIYELDAISIKILPVSFKHEILACKRMRSHKELRQVRIRRE